MQTPPDADPLDTDAPWDTSQAGGTHPTGMHTCIHFCAWSTSQENVICDSFFLPDEPDFGWDVRYLSIGTGNVYVSCALHNTVSKLISCSFCPGFYMLYSQCDTTKLMRTNCGRTETRGFRLNQWRFGNTTPTFHCARVMNEYSLAFVNWLNVNIEQLSTDNYRNGQHYLQTWAAKLILGTKYTAPTSTPLPPSHSSIWYTEISMHWVFQTVSSIFKK